MRVSLFGGGKSTDPEGCQGSPALKKQLDGHKRDIESRLSMSDVPGGLQCDGRSLHRSRAEEVAGVSHSSAKIRRVKSCR